MQEAIGNFRKRDYWIVENLEYVKPSFRLQKCARIINELTKNRSCELLDVGCGPAALRQVLNPNINYHGIDIAIQKSAPYLREVDFAVSEISFDQKRFDVVTALGVFEYMGQNQKRKSEEIRNVLKPGGKFIMSYINFGHCRSKVWPNYNNVQSIADMKKSLESVFQLERWFPASHHWRPKQPGRNAIPALQMRLNSNIPLLSPLFAVEYLFICSPRN